ncbi:MAG TPA: hypothetical protein VG142_14740 [Trebonia sp.]|jgi:YVTN family beta-propeller protein|nr:hypothetical protein [Trebonia sp.]
MRLKAMSLLPALTVILGLVALPAGGASADTTASLPMSNFDQMVVDSAKGYLFISEGSPLGGYTAGANSILVTNLNGNPVTTITGQDGVKGLALSPDGSTLYAALSGDNEISAINTSTLKQTAVYGTGGETPWNLAIEDGILWVGYNTPDGGGGIGYINPDAADPAFENPGIPGNQTFRFAPSIAGDPDNVSSSSTTGTLVASSTGNTPTPIYSYEISGATVTSYNYSSIESSCDPQYGLAVLPGGSQFIVDCEGDTLYDTATMAPSSAESSYYPGSNSLAIAPDGTVATGYTDQNVPDQVSLPDLYVYPSGSISPAPSTGYALDTTSSYLTPNGLAWNGNSELFALMTDGSSSSGTVTGYTLRTFYPGLASSGITLNGPSSAKGGETVTLTGTLSRANGTVPSDTKITITRAQSGSTSTKTITGTTTTGGEFKITDVPPSSGMFTYTASYAGSGTVAPATSAPPVKVTVTKSTPSLTIATSASTAAYGAKATVTATLGKTDTNRSVSIYETPAGGSKKLVKSGTVNSKGQLAVSETLDESASFVAAFTGDEQYAAVTTAAKSVGIDAKVSEYISGYYGSQKVGTATYWLYRNSGKVAVTVDVVPDKHGECVKLEVQRYSDGQWKSYTTTGCTDLNSSSRAGITLTLSRYPLGSRYRVSAEYIRSSKDLANLSADSGWLYFEVLK